MPLASDGSAYYKAKNCNSALMRILYSLVLKIRTVSIVFIVYNKIT